MKRIYVSIILGVLFFVLIAYVSVTSSIGNVVDTVYGEIQPIVISSYDEDLFGNKYGLQNRNTEILEFSVKTNDILKGWIKPSLYPIKNLVVQIHEVDGEKITMDSNYSETSNRELMNFKISRNEISRNMVISLYYRLNYIVILLMFIVIMALFIITFKVIPAPLNSKQKFWYKKMISDDISSGIALKLSKKKIFNVSLNKVQTTVFNTLYDEGVDLEESVQFACSENVDNLDGSELLWFKSIYQKTKDINEAIRVALSPDKLLIDPLSRQLVVHGLEIDINHAPLAYYAWYALKRTKGDGWVKNPNSNRPDHVYSLELDKLFFKWGVHGAAIKAFEHGVKSETLNNNRSKICDSIKNSICDESLVDLYCFEDKYSENGGVKEFRLKINPQNIDLVT